MKLALFQMDVVSGDVAENFHKVAMWIEKTAHDYAPDILVLPELWSTSYAYEILSQIADHNGTKTKAFLSELAKRHHVNIIGGSIANIIDGKVYNTMMAFGRDGQLVGSYSKTHLASTMDEDLHFASSPVPDEVFELDGVKEGGAICYDLRFPETVRFLAVEGAEILFFVAAWPCRRLEHWTYLLRARAVENQVFAVGCNRVSLCDGLPLGGHSIVYGPAGEVVAQASDTTERTLFAEVDLADVKKMRETVPVFVDRRPEAYSFL